MNSNRHITWENFKNKFVEPGDPAVHQIAGKPDCFLFVDGKCMGIRIAAVTNSPPAQLPFQHIRSELVSMSGQSFIQISCEKRALHQAFFSMLLNVADLIQLHEYEPEKALRQCAEQYITVLSSHSILSEEKQIGLWCELWVLERLVALNDLNSLDAWIGPLEEPHDFRLSGLELEVKGTRSRKRQHIISSESQLQPSLGHDLYMVSVQLEPGAGDDFSDLPQMVERGRAAIAETHLNAQQYEALLSEWGYKELHEPFYRQQYGLRTEPALVPIDGETPRIAADMLRDALGKDRAKRISKVQFKLDVTDMGYLESEQQFQKVIKTK